MNGFLLAGVQSAALTALYRALREHGEEADMVATCSAAVQRMAVKEYRRIVLCEQMPGGNALDVMRVFPELARRVLIVCEAEPTPQLREEACRMGGAVAGPDVAPLAQELLRGGNRGGGRTRGRSDER